jgi:hypothetical protein
MRLQIRGDDMSEVLIDDSSLNAIAHSIRRKNGLLRTYKPREMAPAIRAFNDFVPDAHSFTINVQQSPHQTIRIRKYLDADQHEYTNTFTVSEPFYKLDITVEADGGYIAGQPNYESPVTVDRDMIIHASPATEAPPETITTVYMNRNKSRFTSTTNWWFNFYSDPECTQQVNKNNLIGKIRVIDVGTGIIYSGTGILGDNNSLSQRCQSITEADVSTIDVSNYVDFYESIGYCLYLKRITGFETWRPINAESFESLFGGSERLNDVGDMSGWQLPELTNARGMFSSTKIESLDLHDWYTPKLTNVIDMLNCSSLRVVDISGITTTKIINSSGFLGGSVRYVIMDSQEMKFTGSSTTDGGVIFNNPNSYVKYLVPDNLVNIYKTHPNW